MSDVGSGLAAVQGQNLEREYLTDPPLNNVMHRLVE